MWLLGNSSTIIDNRFTEFLESDEYRSEQVYYVNRFKSETPPSLLEIVEMWLVSTDAILVVPSYELLLVAIFGWIDEWIATDHKLLLGSALWDVDGREQAVTRLVSSAREDKGAQPFLTKADFAMRKALAKQAQLNSLDDKLKQITRTTSKSGSATFS